jgi:hypothetical protein
MPILEQDLILRQREEAAATPITAPQVELSMEASMVIGPSWMTIPGTPITEPETEPDEVSIVTLDDYSFSFVFLMTDDPDHILKFYLNGTDLDPIIGNFLMLRSNPENLVTSLIVVNEGTEDIKLYFWVGAEPSLGG